MTALILAIAAILISAIGVLVSRAVIGSSLETFEQNQGNLSESDPNNSEAVGDVIGASLLGFLIQGIATMTGIGAIVVGIIGIAKNRGRALGIVALVIAVAGPYIALTMFEVFVA